MTQAHPALQKWIIINFILSLLVILIFPIAAGGTHAGIWSYVYGLAALRWVVYLGILVIVLSIVLLCIVLKRRVAKGLTFVLLSLILAIVAISPLLYQAHLAKTLPRIHDITTDADNPPQFQAVIPLRPARSNTLVYDRELAIRQQLAYPMVQPIFSHFDLQQAFPLAVDVIQQLGWTIVQANEDRGIIEATDTSFWFGFTDDIVVRIQPDPAIGGTRIDLRSVSRVGVSDIGANAARIEKFITLYSALEQR